MRKVLAAALLLVAASLTSQGQTCVFTATQDQNDKRRFTLTPAAGSVINFGREPTDSAYGVFWKRVADLGAPADMTETRMQVVSWEASRIVVRIPDTLTVCAGSYLITLRIPPAVQLPGQLPGQLLDCRALPVTLAPENAPSRGTPACAVLPACVLTATPTIASPGAWVALTSVPTGSLMAGPATLTCRATNTSRPVTVENRNGQLGVVLPSQGLDCAGGLYSLQAGQCQTVISIMPALLPTPVECGAVQTAAERFFKLRVADAAPGLPVGAALVDANGRELPNVALTVPGVAAGVTVSSVRWSVSDAADRDTLTAGSDYVTGPGASNRRAVFTLAPQVVEARSGVRPPTVRRFVRATLTLAVALPTGMTNCTLTVTAPFNQAALPVPKVLALFRRADFDTGAGVGHDAGIPQRKAVLVVVPPDAVDSAGRPINGLGRLVVELNRLGGLLPSGSFPASSPLGSAAALALGLQELRDKLSTATRDATYRFNFRLANDISSLRDVEMLPDKRIHAEDLFNSLMYVGPAGSGAAFYNNQKFVMDQGAFEMKLAPGSFFATMRALTFRNDAEAAAVTRGATVRVLTAPGGPKYAIIGHEVWGNDLCCHQAQTFGAELSSLRFYR